MACNTLSRPGDPGDAVWILNVARGGRGVPPLLHLSLGPWISVSAGQRVDANLPALISAAPCAVCVCIQRGSTRVGRGAEVEGI